jgi:hypothetical protein
MLARTTTTAAIDAKKRTANCFDIPLLPELLVPSLAVFSFSFSTFADADSELVANTELGEGATVGSVDGAEVGSADGSEVGSEVGSADGSPVGSAVGSLVGASVGSAVGSSEGKIVGMNDGASFVAFSG